MLLLYNLFMFEVLLLHFFPSMKIENVSFEIGIKVSWNDMYFLFSDYFPDLSGNFSCCESKNNKSSPQQQEKCLC